MTGEVGEKKKRKKNVSALGPNDFRRVEKGTPIAPLLIHVDTFIFFVANITRV